MNAKQLKDVLENVPDDVTVVVPSNDHGYREVWAAIVTTAMKSKEGWLCEDYGALNGPESAQDKRIAVLVIQ
jgi:hypothetical protein